MMTAAGAGAPTEKEIWEELKCVYTDIDKCEFRGVADGKIDIEVVPCVCKYEDSDDRQMACGDLSGCINRALFFECSPEDCPCGSACLNQRFSKRQYANIEVIKTEKKGYGLRTKVDLKRNDFVIEYVGEVIPHSMFQKRAREYGQNGAKHFYFMSLKPDEFIDAYRRGNIARFMNHSCAPNCEVQKWVVGSELRMGIFTRRDIRAGEELTFDYKFERYGAEPQTCHCGESVCKGIIGGATLAGAKHFGDDEYDDDDEEDFDNSVGGEPKRRRSQTRLEDDDDEFRRPPSEEKGLETVEQIQKLVKAMLYSSTKPLKFKRCLRKLEVTASVTMQRKFIQYHGLSVMKSCISHFLKSDESLCYEAMRILKSFPISSRNSIIDCKLEETIQKLGDNPHYQIANLSKELLESWSQLPTIYKIPKRLSVSESPGGSASTGGDPSRKRVLESDESSNKKKSRFDGSATPDLRDNQVASTTINDPSGNANESAVFYPRPFPRKPDDNMKSWKSPTVNGGYASPRPIQQHDLSANGHGQLPPAWKSAKTPDGKIYFYNTITRNTQWEMPKEAPAGAENVRSLSSIVEGVSDADIDAIVKQASAAAATSSQHNNVDERLKNLRSGVSEIVVKTLSKYKTEIDGEKFKKMARKITHQILEKESKQPGPPPATITEEMKQKMKKFVKSALERAGIKNTDAVTGKSDKHSSSSSKKKKT